MTIPGISCIRLHIRFHFSSPPLISGLRHKIWRVELGWIHRTSTIRRVEIRWMHHPSIIWWVGMRWIHNPACWDVMYPQSPQSLHIQGPVCLCQMTSALPSRHRQRQAGLHGPWCGYTTYPQFMHNPALGMWWTLCQISATVCMFKNVSTYFIILALVVEEARWRNLLAKIFLKRQTCR